MQKVHEGWHGAVLKLSLGSENLALKVPLKSEFSKNIKKEAKILREVNNLRIGPPLLYEGLNFFACEFIEGENFDKFVEHEEDPQKLREVVLKILLQARLLDKHGICKGEMHKPTKNIIVKEDLDVVLIDFERAKKARKPKNVTGFFQFLMFNPAGRKIIGNVDTERVKRKLAEYKGSYSDDVFEELLGLVNLSSSDKPTLSASMSSRSSICSFD